jgi:hypothetical protein
MNSDNLDLALQKLEDALTTYSTNYGIEHDIEVLFLGSQSILFHHKNINNNAIINSYEIDIIVLLGKNYKDKLEKISNHLDFAYGYGSNLHDEEMFYIDNMSDPEDEEANIRKFPKNWRSRSKTKQGEVNSKINFTFLDIHDVCILKLSANREKDLDYVQTLIQGSILDKKTLKNCLFEMKDFIDENKTNSIKNKINYFYTLPQVNIFNSKNKFKPK